MMKVLCFWQHFREPIQASPEARAALAEARKIRQTADTVYSDRADLLRTNHFADRIRLIYEGH
jgi:hypothetical protein